MSALAEQIAREHHPIRSAFLGGMFDCACPDPRLFNIDAYAAHIATVTERAVVERVAADLGAIQLPDDYEPDGADAYWDGVLDTHMWWQTKALNIVRGGTR